MAEGFWHHVHAHAINASAVGGEAVIFDFVSNGPQCRCGGGHVAYMRAPSAVRCRFCSKNVTQGLRQRCVSYIRLCRKYSAIASVYREMPQPDTGV